MIKRASGRTASTVAEVFGLLKELFGGGMRFLITNQSMYELLRLYEPQLLRSIVRGTERHTFAEWRDDVSSFRSAWLAHDPEATSRFQSRELPVVTESATHDAHQKCGRRKVEKRPKPRAVATFERVRPMKPAQAAKRAKRVKRAKRLR